MNRTPAYPIRICVGVVAVAAMVTLASCRPPQADSGSGDQPKSETHRVAEPQGAFPAGEGALVRSNSFDAVSRHLDKGGDFYQYVGAEPWKAELANWRKEILPLLIPRVEGSNSRELVEHLLTDSGIDEISGYGRSGLEIGEGLHRTRTLLHHYPDQAGGWLWRMFSRKPRPLQERGVLPRNTMLAFHLELDLADLWQLVLQETGTFEHPDVAQVIHSFPARFEEALGIPLAKILSAQAGGVTAVLTLDPTIRFVVPRYDGLPVLVRRPDVLVIVRTHHAELFQRLEKKVKAFPGLSESTLGDTRIVSLSVPLPLEVKYELVLAQTRDCILFSTSTQLMRDVLSIKQGRLVGLQETPGFATLVEGLPREGHGFYYLGEQVGEFKDMLEQLEPQPFGGSVGESIVTVDRVLNPLHGMREYGVFTNTESGWTLTSQGNRDPSLVSTQQVLQTALTYFLLRKSLVTGY